MSQSENDLGTPALQEATTVYVRPDPVPPPKPFDDFDVVTPTKPVVESIKLLPANGFGKIESFMDKLPELTIDRVWWHSHSWLITFENEKGIYYPGDFLFVRKSGKVRPPDPIHVPKPKEVMKVEMPAYNGPPRFIKTGAEILRYPETPSSQLISPEQAERYAVEARVRMIIGKLQDRRRCRSWASLARILEQEKKLAEEFRDRDKPEQAEKQNPE